MKPYENISVFQAVEIQQAKDSVHIKNLIKIIESLNKEITKLKSILDLNNIKYD